MRENTLIITGTENPSKSLTIPLHNFWYAYNHGSLVLRSKFEPELADIVVNCNAEIMDHLTTGDFEYIEVRM